MAKDYLGLEYNEVVIIKDESVAHGGIGALLTSELVLTNQRIICAHKGMFGNVKQVFSYPLYEIKTHEGKPQVMEGRLSNGARSLDVYLVNGVEHFQFGTRKRIEKWIEEIYNLFDETVERKSEDEYGYPPDSILGVYAEVGQMFKDIIGIRSKPKGKVISQQETKISKKCISCSAPLVGAPGQTVRCKYCGTSQTLYAEPKQSQAMPLDQQIEMINKLKELVDAGILTKEEFEKKKKEIMGL